MKPEDLCIITTPVIASPGPALAGYIRYEQLFVIASKPQRALPAVINERNFFIHNVSW
jgi:hypothetical protein